MTQTTSYQVNGMTCAHCVQAVKKELSALDGVTDVVVDLQPGAVSTVKVTGTGPLPREVGAAAVDEAGYELV